MRNGILTNEQIRNLQNDKKKGMTASAIMDKYGIKKTSYFKYLKTNVSSSSPPSRQPQKKNVREMTSSSESESESESESSSSSSSDDDPPPAPAKKEVIEESESESESESEQDTVQKFFEQNKVVEEKEPVYEIDVSDYNPTEATEYFNTIFQKREKDEEEKKNAPKNMEKKQAEKTPKPPPKPKMPKLKKTKLPKVPKQQIEPLTPEKEAIINKIINYTENFKEKLETYLPIKGAGYPRFIGSLYKKSQLELENMLDFIRKKVTHVNTKNAFKMVYNIGANALEKSGPNLGLKLDGLAEEVNRSKEIDKILSELSCEYSFDKYMDPKLRLLAFTGMSVLKLDSQNKREEMMKHHRTHTEDILKSEVPSELEQKYNEI